MIDDPARRRDEGGLRALVTMLPNAPTNGFVSFTVVETATNDTNRHWGGRYATRAA